MPDDRESNFAGTGLASQGAYPTVRRFNLGINLTFKTSSNYEKKYIIKYAVMACLSLD